MLAPISTKYAAIPVRRPSRSATIGSTTQPMIVPIESSPVPYEASRAAEREHPAPAEVRADEIIRERREEESEVVAGVHVAGAHLAAILGPFLGDERAADRLLAADADAAQHAQRGELPDVGHERAQE